MRESILSRFGRAIATLVIVSAAVPGSTRAFAGGPNSPAEQGLQSQPAIHGDQVVFVSEGDLWTTTLDADPARPIVAHRLTSTPGRESRPVLSVDGQWIAFAAEVEGNTDVYIMPAQGGTPRRLTYHPSADVPLVFTPDGSAVLFRSNRAQPLGRPELWRIGVGGGMPVREALGECTLAALSATGKQIVFNRWSNESWNWRRYRGGTAPDLWIGDFDTGTFRTLAADPANDLFPMWMQGRVYFLSDRTGTTNFFSVAPNGEDVRQHTMFVEDSANPTAIENYVIRDPSADTRRGGGRIVFTQGGQLALLDVSTGEVHRLDVGLVSDRKGLRTEWIDPRSGLTDFAVSPDGKVLAVGARGEIAVLPIGDPKPGDSIGPVQVTRSHGAREWGPAFLRTPAVGLRVVFVTDMTGEQQIGTVAADGSDAPSLLTDDRTEWLFPPVVSPDGLWIAFGDKQLRLFVLNTVTLERRLVDTSDSGEITDYRFSPDSQWLAYSKPEASGYSSVSLYSLRTERSFPVSNGMFSDDEPRWDPAGKYLYLLSKRNFNPLLSEVDFEHAFVNMTEVFALPLASTTPPPDRELASIAGFDLEAWAKSGGDDDDDDDDDDDEDNGDEADGDAAPRQPAPGETAPIRIDTDDMPSRLVRLPVDAGELSSLEATPGGLIYIRREPRGLNDEEWPAPPMGAASGTLERFDALEGEAEVIAEEVAAVRVDQSGAVIVVARENGLAVVKGPKKLKTIPFGDLRLRVDPVAEWRHIFEEAWRLQRDFYWHPQMNGVDWTRMRERYLALLPRVATRHELDAVIGEMLGELGTSHAYIWSPPPGKKEERVRTGLLGADIVFDGAGYRITRILPGYAHSAPGTSDELVSPLAAPWLGVTEGSYLIAIDGVPLAPQRRNVYDLLQDRADKLVRLTVADDAQGRNARTITIRALGSEQELRYAAWVDANRRHVSEASNGALGYMHLPDMDAAGLSAFSMAFYPQVDCKGMVVDIRDNGGGFVSQMIVQRLARRPWAFQKPRHGRAERYPQRSLYGPTAVIIDQHAGSDGDIFPESFRILGLGPLIGTRTWGGVVGIRADKPFIDLGMSTQPEFAWWEPDRGWSLENSGVAPDIEVDLTPADRVAGRDPQLDRAIQWLMQKLEENPVNVPGPPEWK